MSSCIYSDDRAAITAIIKYKIRHYERIQVVKLICFFFKRVANNDKAGDIDVTMDSDYKISSRHIIFNGLYIRVYI